MRSARQTRLADSTDRVPLTDACSWSDARRKVIEVTVSGRASDVVPEDDQLTVAIAKVGGLNDTVGDGEDSGSRRRSVVDPLVSSPGLQDRVQASVGKS